MKTILYNPVFINPQAYFVFPQLYDIEKGDSFIEPAAYAGQLMIENLTDNTKVMLENNVMQVDFTQFAGKHIRINQYTNIGAVVLGEWLLPEGEPSGPSFHQSLVDAWFMSGPSNSDKPSNITGVIGNQMILKNFAFTSESGFGEGTYEGALVFDGVDDYGICTGLPIMTDYTVICRREIINKDYYSVASKSTVFGKGAFIFELIQGRTNHCYSFAADNQISLHNSEISWQTKNSYNGSTITVGNADDTDTLTLGIIREGDESRRFLKGAIYYFALYNKSLTPEEIETEKERLNEEWLKRKTE